MKQERKQDIYAFLEMYYPLFFGTLACILCYFFEYSIEHSINDVLNAIISFVSILLGFLGAIIALLFNFSDNSFVRYIMTNAFYKKRLKHYFKVSILSGFTLLVCSIVMLLQQSITLNMLPFFRYISNRLQYLEVFLIVYFLLSSYRIITFVIKCAFVQYDTKENNYPENQYTDKEIEKLREMCSIEDTKNL